MTTLRSRRRRRREGAERAGILDFGSSLIHGANVKPEEALQRARVVPSHALVITWHARQQMRARKVRAADICRALATAKTVIAQEAPTKWRFEGGVDADGDDLIVVASFENGVVIVSVFA